MAIKYVKSGAAGGGDGTTTATSGANGAWTFAEMLAATPAAGDEIRVCADATYDRTATATITWANGTPAANIRLTGANSSGVVDGTRPTIRATAGTLTLLTITSDHIDARYFIVDGNGQTSVTGWYHNATYGRSRWIKATGTTVYGIRVFASTNNGYCERLEAVGCSGTGGIYVGAAGAYFIDSHGNSCTGIMCDANARLMFFKSYANTGHGIDLSSVGFHALQGIVYGNTSKGINLEGNAGYGTFLANVVSYGNTGQDFYASAVRSGVYLLNCAGRAGVANNNNGTGYHTTNLPNVENYGTLTGDPFTNSAGGIFLPNTTAGQGLILRALGMNIWPDGGTSYFDIGLQHQDAASSTNIIQRRRHPR